MQYVLSVVFAALLVIAQTSWKRAVDSPHSPFHATVSVPALIRFVFSPLVLLGIALYILGIGLYMFLLSRYQFSLIQSMAIPLSLIFSIVVAVGFMHETLSYANYAGLFLIVVGIVLVTQR